MRIGRNLRRPQFRFVLRGGVYGPGTYSSAEEAARAILQLYPDWRQELGLTAGKVAGELEKEHPEEAEGVDLEDLEAERRWAEDMQTAMEISRREHRAVYHSWERPTPCPVHSGQSSAATVQQKHCTCRN